MDFVILSFLSLCINLLSNVFKNIKSQSLNFCFVYSLLYLLKQPRKINRTVFSHTIIVTQCPFLLFFFFFVCFLFFFFFVARKPISFPSPSGRPPLTHSLSLSLSLAPSLLKRHLRCWSVRKEPAAREDEGKRARE
jgi:hypothetical protein